jgi:hypothetical protein
MPNTKRASKTTRNKARSVTATNRGNSKTKSVTTTDHDEIRRWAEARDGSPACVRGTGGRGDVGMLRIDFPGGAERSLQKISWNDWFDKFNERKLAFLYQNRRRAGE